MAFLTGATHGDAATARLYDLVLPRASLQEMWKPLHPTSPADGDKSESMGLSFFVEKRGAVTLIGHTGSQAGFRAFMYLNPATGAGVVAVVNTEVDLPVSSKPTAAVPALTTIREAVQALIEH
jgi:CubicO group peptidase (beta-lactamase class C family)